MKFLPEMTDEQKDCQHATLRNRSTGAECMACGLSYRDTRRAWLLAEITELLNSEEGKELLEHTHSYFSSFERKTGVRGEPQ